MIIELAILGGLGVGGYELYKNGKLKSLAARVTALETAAKAEVTKVETAVKADVAAVEADVKKVV